MSVERDDLVLDFWNERLDTPLSGGHVAEFQAATVTLFEAVTYSAASSPYTVPRECTQFSDTPRPRRRERENARPAATDREPGAPTANGRV